MRVLSFCLLATLVAGCLPQQAVPAPVSSDNTAALEQRIDELEAMVDQQLSMVDQRLADLRSNSVSATDIDVLTARVNALSTADLSALEARLEALETMDNTALLARIDGIEASMAAISGGTGADPALAAMVQALGDRLAELEAQVEDLETGDVSQADPALALMVQALGDELAELEAQVEDLETGSVSQADLDALSAVASAGMAELADDVAVLQGEGQQLSDALAAVDAALVTVETEGELLSDELTTMQGELDALAGVADQVSALRGTVATLDAQRESMEGALASAEDDIGRLQRDSIQIVTSAWSREIASEQDLVSALNELDRIRFVPGGSATLDIVDGFEIDNVIRMDHPQGEYIQIIGDTSDRSSVDLNFDNVGAFLLEDGARLGRLDGVVLTGSAGHNGIVLKRGASMRLGSHVTVRDFSVGIHLEDQSSLDVVSGCGVSGDYDRVLVDESVSFGIRVLSGSFLEAPNCVVQDAQTSGVYVRGKSFVAMPGGGSIDNGGKGIDVSQDSFFNAIRFESSGNGAAGMLVSNNSTVDASVAIVSDNEGNGVYANHGSVVVADDSTINSNDDNGVVAQNASYVRTGVSVSRNGSRGVYALTGGTVFGIGTDLSFNAGLDVQASYDSTCRMDGSAIPTAERGVGNGGQIFTN